MNILDNTTEPDELDVWILRLAKYANTLTPYKLDDPIDPIVQDGLNEAKQAIEAIIRTEKLELLAEVRELLIDRIPVYDGDDSFGKEYQAGYNSMAHATRTMQLQQRAELTKLEAEV